MGYRNAQIVHGRWGHLPPQQFRLLAWMALRTMDGATEPTWAGRREDLALGLGHALPDEPAADDGSHWAREARAHRKRILSRVAFAIHGLAKAGAIAGRWGGHRGAPASYLLNISNLPLGARDTPKDAAEAPVENGQEPGDNSGDKPVDNTAGRKGKV